MTSRNPLESWLAEVADALGVDAAAADDLDVRGLLDLTRNVAHDVARPAGPLTTFLVGVAVGAGATDLERAMRTVAELAARRAQTGSETG